MKSIFYLLWQAGILQTVDVVIELALIFQIEKPLSRQLAGEIRLEIEEFGERRPGFLRTIGKQLSAVLFLGLLDPVVSLWSKFLGKGPQSDVCNPVERNRLPGSYLG